MVNSFCSIGNLAVVSTLLLLGIFLTFDAPKELIFSCPNSQKGVSDDLSAVLEKASEGNNKTVILAVVNEAYVDSHDEQGPAINMLDMFIESFWLGEETRPLINHLVIVATDPTAYGRCLFRGLHCFLLVDHQTEDGDSAGEKVFESKAFINMMWRRTFFLLTVLNKGYNFIFTDIDVMWLRNPFTRLKIDETKDMEFSTDFFNGDSESNMNPINTGFYHVRSNHKTVTLFERWYSMRNSSDEKEQNVLQKLIGNGVMTELNLTLTFLNTRHFSGFCQESPEPREVVTVHANCCRYIDAKVKDLASVLNDWKRFKRLENNATQLLDFAWSPHVNCQNSWQH